MGWSVGRWDGETLVIEVTDHMAETWFDRSGNHHSDALKVTERYTAIDPNTLQYEATIEDPNTFSKPWKISMPLYRRREPNVQLMEYKCVEFTEELLYGHLRKKWFQGSTFQRVQRLGSVGCCQTRAAVARNACCSSLGVTKWGN